MSFTRKLKLLYLFTLILILTSGCGFYLRTTNLGSYLTTVNLNATLSPLLEHELKRVFSRNDIAISESDNADLTVLLKDYEFQKSTSLVVPREGLTEYELILQVSFTLWFSGDEDSAEEISFSKAGRVRVHPNQLLSTSAEEQTVRKELTQGVVEDFVQDLYLRLAHESEAESPNAQ